MLTTADRVGFPHRREIVTIVLAVVPFILNVTQISTRNGVVVSYSDFADVILGALLVVLTLRNIVFVREGEAKYRVIRIILTVVLLALAAFHIAGGLGLLFGMPYPLGYGS